MASCKLIIKDEVNIRLEGLDVAVRRKLANTFKYIPPHAKYMPAARLGRWDGAIAFFGIGGDGYLYHLPEILKILDSNNVSITEIEDKRNPVNISFSSVDENFWGDTCWPVGHHLAGEKIVIKDHQVTAINAYLQNPQSIQSLPTSSGKTIISATLAKLAEPYGRTITIVPNTDLVIQTSEDYRNCGLDVGLYYGGRKELNRKHTISTWQSLSVLAKKEKKFKGDMEDLLTLTKFLDGVETVIVDECFDGDSEVLTSTGYKLIKDIQVGEKIVNYDESKKIYKEDEVVKIYTNLSESIKSDMFELEFDNQSVIKVTGNHKFLTNVGWKTVYELDGNDEIISTTIIIMLKIVKKTIIEKPDIVYNLHIKDDHNYIVNDAVVANCHTLKANELNTLLVKHISHAPIRWAMTGTIPKEPYFAESLYTAIGPLVNKITAKSLQDEGILSSCNINIMQLIEIKGFKDYTEEMQYLVTDKKRLDFISKMITSIAESGNTLILVNRIETGKYMASLIPGAVFISGEVKNKARKDEYDAFKTSNSKILIATSGVAAVGINIISLYNLVMIEPGKSFVRVIQSIGRGLRKGLEKDHVEIWDITATCKYSKTHLTERKRYYKEAAYPFKVNKIDWNK
jgi:superfamily II DNA or RNA helicase